MKNFRSISPLGYLDFIKLLKHSSLVLTDSGGIQEEAASLSKPVIVMRDVTERPEAMESDTFVLAGTERQGIRQAAEDLLNNHKSASTENPFGDGDASIKISKALGSQLRSL